jgi:hypothetical protein
VSEPLKMHTSLPGLPDVEIWLNIDWIIVKYGELISYRYAHELGPEERDAMRAALTQATA